MNIDFVKTAERVAVLNLAEVGRQCGVSRETVVKVAKGLYPCMHTENARKVIDKLREYGVLVEYPDDLDKAA